MSISDMQVSDKPEGISIQHFINKVKLEITYLKKQWISILLFSLLGGLIGFAYSYFSVPLYTAECTFVLEDGSSKGGSLGQYSGLASLAGIDLNGSSGIFQGENIIELYKSRLMIERTLLRVTNINNKPGLLIDRYIAFNKLAERWKKHDHIDNISFTGNPENFNRKQDSIITDIVNFFNKKALTVVKPDKKLSIFKVSATMNDETFARDFLNYWVENVNDFYTQTKTKKSLQNLKVLQHQEDSVHRVLNSSIYGVASALDASPNSNPMMTTLRAGSQKKQVDVQANVAVYAEIVKNLEVSKISFLQDKPLIQMIDKPILPLKVTKVSKSIGILAGFFLAFILTLTTFVAKKLFKEKESQ